MTPRPFAAAEGRRGGRGRAGAGRQTGAEGSRRAGRGGGSTGSGALHGRECRPPRRGAGTSVRGGEGAESTVTALRPLSQARFVAQDLAASLPSLQWELGRKKPLSVRCTSSLSSGFICFPILMSLWIINFFFGGGGIFVGLLGLLLLFKTSWIGLRSSQSGKRWHKAGAHGERVGCGGRRDAASL